MRVNTVVSLTFDDGLASQFLACELLRRHSLQATFFVSSGRIDTAPRYLSWTQLADLAGAGHEIGGHTLDHSKLTDPHVDAFREVAEDRQRLLDRGFTASSFAYPYGAFDEQARAAVAASGYRSARRSWGLCSRPGDGCPCAEQIPPRDPLATLTASSFTRDTDLSEIQAVVLRAEASGGWLQLVFHDVLDDGGLYSMSLELFEQSVEWIVARAERGTVVRTVGDVMGGGVIPPAAVGS